jgi:hypothetical protein
MSLYVVEVREFVSVLVQVLARRIHNREEWPALSKLPLELMEMLLKSSDLDLMGFERVPRFVDKYIKTREKRFGEKITLRRVRQFKNLAMQLYQLRKLCLRVDPLWDMRTEDRVIAPGECVYRLKDSFYSQLKECSDLEYFTYQIPAALKFGFLLDNSVTSATGTESAGVVVETMKQAEESLIPYILLPPTEDLPGSPPETPSSIVSAELPHSSELSDLKQLVISKPATTKDMIAVWKPLPTEMKLGLPPCSTSTIADVKEPKSPRPKSKFRGRKARIVIPEQ